MSFTFNSGIPAAANNPSFDQPEMLANNVATEGILNVDHITFNANNGGTHRQTSFGQLVNPAVLAGTPASVAYPNAGVADNSRAMYYFRNSHNIPFPVSLIRAYGTFDNAGVSLNSINMTVVSNGPPNNRTYTITMPANTVTGTNYGVLCQAEVTALNPGVTANYSVLTATTFDIVFRSLSTGGTVPPDGMTIVVFQI